MLQYAYFLAKIGADIAENEQHFADILPIGRRGSRRSPGRSSSGCGPWTVECAAAGGTVRADPQALLEDPHRSSSAAPKKKTSSPSNTFSNKQPRSWSATSTARWSTRIPSRRSDKKFVDRTERRIYCLIWIVSGISGAADVLAACMKAARRADVFSVFSR